MSKREYSKPMLSSSSKFERRGLLASCCQTEAQACAAGEVSSPFGSQQVCDPGQDAAKFQNAQIKGASTT